MENTCSQYLFLFLLSLSTSPPPPVQASRDRLRFVHGHRISKNWANADAYCSSHYGGISTLANARNAHDLSYFSDICGGPDVSCFVGLRYSWNVLAWMWKNGQSNSLPDTTWHGGNSIATGKVCAYVSRGKLFDAYCGIALFFLCEHNLVLEEEKTWEEALDHCRALGPDASDLLGFHDEEELSHFQDEMIQSQTEEVWIGLRWLAGRWLWMDRAAGGVVTLPECPANGNHCGTLSGRGQQARSCVEKRRFFCRKLPPV